MARTYRYFVSFRFDNAYGNAEITYDSKIDGIGAIKEAERILQKENKQNGSVVILYYQLMRIEDE